MIDANFDDWRTIEPILTDPADAPAAFVDLGEVRVTHDDRFVHLLVDFGKTVNIQGLDGTATILIDGDGDPKTGRTEHDLPGVDLMIDLTPPNLKTPGTPGTPGPPGMGIGLRSATYAPDPNDLNAKNLSPYDIGMVSGPTHAGRRMEFRFERGRVVPNTPPLFAGAQFTGKIVFADLSGDIADATDAFTYRLAEAPDTARAADGRDPLARDESAACRIVSWNAERGAIVSNPEPFARTLAALQPDVVLLQELTDDNNADQLRSFFARLPRRNDEHEWSVLFGSGGGDLRCAIASRFPLTSAMPLELVTYPDNAERSIRVLGGIVECAGRRLLAVSTHLKCCGRTNGPEDQTRLVEVDMIRTAISTTLASSPIAGLIVAGDFNLVGAREPLENMAIGLDLDGSALAIAEPYQLDGLSNCTWRDPDQPFVPGRLDYCVYADSAATVVHTFVYDSSDLSRHWREHHAVQLDDTDHASDHLPLVIDLKWQAPK